MKIFRARTPDFQESPVRQLFGFGKKGNILIAPLDICLFEQKESERTIINSIVAGQFIGVEVSTTGSIKVGDIDDYDQPTPLSFSPIVKIKTNPSFTIPPGLKNFVPVDANQVKKDDKVVITNGGTKIEGQITNPTPEDLPYIESSFKVKAYQVKFQQRLNKSLHGSRVVYPATGKILGMLIFSENQNAIVYPADLI